MKTIEKKCIITEDLIEIRLEDIRDNYIYQNALGDIGSIYISNEGIQIFPHFDPNSKIYSLRNKELLQIFKEIFDTTEYNPLSNEYFHKINQMIENKTLEKLGYIIEKTELIDEFEEIDILTYHKNKTY